MSDQSAKGTPPLIDLVRAGEGRHDADKVTDFLFTAVDQTNAHLVTTDDGDVLINTGTAAGAERNKAILKPHRTGSMPGLSSRKATPITLAAFPRSASREPKSSSSRASPRITTTFLSDCARRWPRERESSGRRPCSKRWGRALGW